MTFLDLFFIRYDTIRYDEAHAAGQCFAHSSKCMDTCGVCHLDARLDCSFEDGLYEGMSELSDVYSKERLC